MSKKTSAIIFVIVAFVIVGIITVIANSSGSSSSSTQTYPGKTSAGSETTNPSAGTTVTPVTPVTPGTTATATYTLAQVATHKTPTNCWTTINGGVYNVTSWIDQHPGGAEAIISLCGIDGSSAFNDQHGGERRPANELASFKIGTLAK